MTDAVETPTATDESLLEVPPTAPAAASSDRWRVVALVALAFVAGLGVGVGAMVLADRADSPTSKKRSTLTDDEEFKVSMAESAFIGNVLNGGQYAETLDGVEDIQAIARRKPCAKFKSIIADDTVTMREFLGAVASDFQPYKPEISDELDRAREDLPKCAG